MWHCLTVTWYCGIKILVFIWRLRDKLTEGGSHQLLAVSWRCWRLVADIWWVFDGYLTGILHVFEGYLTCTWRCLFLLLNFQLRNACLFEGYYMGISWVFTSSSSSTCLFPPLVIIRRPYIWHLKRNYLTAISTIVSGSFVHTIVRA